MTTDERTTLAAAQTMVREFCEARDWDRAHTPKDLAIGLVTEASELLELFRFVPEVEVNALINDPAKRAQIADELADSLYCVLRFAQLYKFDLATCYAKNCARTRSSTRRLTSDCGRRASA